VVNILLANRASLLQDDCIFSNIARNLVMNRPLALAGAFLACLLATTHLRGEVVALEILHREPFAGGVAFGDTGPYEKIVGIVRFAVDPKHARNQLIVDLDKAPTNAQKKVEFAADVCILMPKDPAKGNRAIFYDVNNRGNKLALRFFNFAPGGNDPSKAADAGDGFLFRRGYTVVWCGWIGELLPGGGRMLMKPPVATDDGKPIRGPVRQEMVADSPTESMPLSRRGGHGSYRPTKEGLAKATLTWRMRAEGDFRVSIPREQWSLEEKPIPEVKEGVAGTLPEIRLKISGGFRPGYIYELIYEGEGPIVQGLGFAGTRDLISFLRYDDSERNPLRVDGKPVIQRAYGFGVSQSGRFLRHFLYQAFNIDEKDRKVFDGVMPHVAGGGLGFFNHRFAQPNRHNGQHEDHSYPGDMFPFTYGKSKDVAFRWDREAKSQPDDGILLRLEQQGEKYVPRVMHTQSSAEYWHRSGSLVHCDGGAGRSADVVLPQGVRVYAFGGTQHGPASDPPGRGIAENLNNPADYRPQLRALLDALDTWVREGKDPPQSVYPRRSNETLVSCVHSKEFSHAQHVGFPALPGVRFPEVVQSPGLYDFGPDFRTRGIITQEPPEKKGGYSVLVPACDPDGNELGMLRPPEVQVPLATYTGWNLRRRDVGAEGMLASLAGSYIPFAKTKAERLKAGDPRFHSIEEGYGSFEEYKKRFTAACDDLVKRRLLLKEDAEKLIAGREKYRDWFPR
jgi:hypothetical protein